MKFYLMTKKNHEKNDKNTSTELYTNIKFSLLGVFRIMTRKT